MEIGRLFDIVFQYSGSKYHERGWKRNMPVFANVFRLGKGGVQPCNPLLRSWRACHHSAHRIIDINECVSFVLIPMVFAINAHGWNAVATFEYVWFQGTMYWLVVVQHWKATPFSRKVFSTQWQTITNKETVQHVLWCGISRQIWGKPFFASPIFSNFHVSFSIFEAPHPRIILEFWDSLRNSIHLMWKSMVLHHISTYVSTSNSPQKIPGMFPHPPSGGLARPPAASPSERSRHASIGRPPRRPKRRRCRSWRRAAAAADATWFF